MSLEYIRNTYKVPAYREVKVSMEGRHGVITGEAGPYVKVKFDDRKSPVPVHPKELVYHLEHAGQESKDD